MKQYKVVCLEEFNQDAGSYSFLMKRTEDEMNRMAALGWRVVCVTNTLFSSLLQHSIVFEKDI